MCTLEHRTKSYVERQQGYILIAVVDVVHDGHGRLARSACDGEQLLGIQGTICHTWSLSSC